MVSTGATGGYEWCAARPTTTATHFPAAVTAASSPAVGHGGRLQAATPPRRQSSLQQRLPEARRALESTVVGELAGTGGGSEPS